MPFTPPKVWASSDIITAADLQSTEDALKLYAHKVPAADLSTAQWVEKRHLMKGRYEPTLNLFEQVSGASAGQQGSFELGGGTFISSYTSRTWASTKIWGALPGTAIALDLRRAADVLILWHANLATRDNQDGNVGWAEHRLHAGVGTGLFYGPNMPTRARKDEGGRVDANRFIHTGGQVALANRSPGRLALGFAGTSDTAKCSVISWGLTVEAYYR